MPPRVSAWMITDKTRALPGADILCERLELTGLMRPFDCGIGYGERVAVPGSNSSGKTQFLRLLFLRLLAGDDMPRSGTARLGARILPGLFAQTDASVPHPKFAVKVDQGVHGCVSCLQVGGYLARVGDMAKTGRPN